VYEKPKPQPQASSYQAPAQKKSYTAPVPQKSYQPPAPQKSYQASASQKSYQPPAPQKTYQAPAPQKKSDKNAADFSYTVVGKQKAGQSVRSPSNTKLVDIQAPDLSQGSQKSLSLANNQLSRSITLSASQSFAGPRPSYGPINPIPDTGDNKDRSAVVRAVVSVSDSDGNLVRRGTVTDITNEQ
jgi:hypothetical protein